jgi:hypothetical protein
LLTGLDRIVRVAIAIAVCISVEDRERLAVFCTLALAESVRILLV